MTEGQKLCKNLAAYLNPEKSAPVIEDIFKGLTEPNNLIAWGGITHLMGEFKKNTSKESEVLALQAFTVGMSIGLSSENPLFKKILNEFFEQCKKARGENVIDFSVAKGMH